MTKTTHLHQTMYQPRRWDTDPEKCGAVGCLQRSLGECRRIMMHPDWCITEPGTAIAVKDGIGYPARAFGTGPTAVGTVADFIKGFKGVAICLYDGGTLCGLPDNCSGKPQPYPAQVASCGQVRFCLPVAEGDVVPVVDGCVYLIPWLDDNPQDDCLAGNLADCRFDISDAPADSIGRIKNTNVECFSCIDGVYKAAMASPHVIGFIGSDVKGAA